MRLFGRSASKLAAGPTLVLSADPGSALFDEARRYDPGVRYSSLLRRLIFSNGVLLLGPVKVTPGVAQRAGLPEGTVVAWHALAALQGHQERRVHDAKAFDGERLVRGLAARLGGTTHPAQLQPARAARVGVQRPGAGHGAGDRGAAALRRALPGRGPRAGLLPPHR